MDKNPILRDYNCAKEFKIHLQNPLMYYMYLLEEHPR